MSHRGHGQLTAAMPVLFQKSCYALCLLPSGGLDKHGIRRWFAWSRSLGFFWEQDIQAAALQYPQLVSAPSHVPGFT